MIDRIKSAAADVLHAQTRAKSLATFRGCKKKTGNVIFSRELFSYMMMSVETIMEIQYVSDVSIAKGSQGSPPIREQHTVYGSPPFCLALQSERGGLESCLVI